MEDHNSILNHIVSITESRDIEILEISLLRTIYEVIPCKDVYLIKTADEDRIIQNASCYGESGYNAACEICGICCFGENESLKEKFSTACATHKAANIDYGDSHFTVCPVDVMSNNIGFIVLDGMNISEQDINVLESLVRIYQNYVSVLLDNQRDTLTGLLNRKTFDDRILKLVELRKREKSDLNEANNERRKNGNGDRFWLGIFDIDDFKKINDSFGHIYGDEILILIGRIMQEIFRTTDMKFRFGGEEFIVVVKADSSETAYSVFERFRIGVESYHFPQTGRITVSIGIVEITGDESPSVFVGCADKALYYAKENGKNKTFLYNDLVEKGLVAPENIRKGDVYIF